MRILLPALTAGLLAVAGCDDGGGDGNGTPDTTSPPDTGADVATDGEGSGDVSSPDGGPSGPDAADDSGPGDDPMDAGGDGSGTDEDGGGGDDGCNNDGDCPINQGCNTVGECVGAQELGQLCGPTADCNSDMDSFPDCLDAQCQSGQCTGSGLGGSILLGYNVCTRPCEIAQDNIDNDTGEESPDGVEDPDVQGSDCSGDPNPFATGGPAGEDYSCVSLADPSQPQQGAPKFCLPGNSFNSCDNTAECPDGEVCQITTVQGSGSPPINERCFAEKQAVEEEDIETSGLAEQCNSDPSMGSLSFCSDGLCTLNGCAPLCTEDADCDTTQGDEEAGCDQETGECKKWPSKSCETDADCSAWRCSEPRALFGSQAPNYEKSVCEPKNCVTDADCKDGFYCDIGIDLTDEGEAVVQNVCVQEKPDGAALGEECDADPSDNVPGPTCQNQNLCIGGNCSATCESNEDCATDNDQLCTTLENPIDTDNPPDDEFDQAVPLDLCQTFPGMGDECLSHAVCGDGQTCTFFEKPNPAGEGNGEGEGSQELDPAAPYVGKGVCSDIPESAGAYGNTCGVTGAQTQQCPGNCLGADPDNNVAGFCTHLCESASECEPIPSGQGDELPTICTSVSVGWGADFDDPKTDIFSGMCFPVFNASGEDCSDDFTCSAEGEACTPNMIDVDPTYDAKVEFHCTSIVNQQGTPQDPSDDTTPEKELGESCNPNATDDEGNPVVECKGAFCLQDLGGENVGYCSGVCDPEADNPCGDGLSCMERVLRPKAAPYDDNEPTAHFCMKDQDCTSCEVSEDCPGNRVCANLGQNDGELADYRCVPGCTEDADCDGESATVCNESTDTTDRMVQGCFEITDETPVNYCDSSGSDGGSEGSGSGSGGSGDGSMPSDGDAGFEGEPYRIPGYQGRRMPHRSLPERLDDVGLDAIDEAR